MTRDNTYFFTYEVRMSEDDFDTYSDLGFMAEDAGKVLPDWKLGKDWCKLLKKRYRIRPKLVRVSMTGHRTNRR
jgi:hypothetical protein